MPTPFKLIKNYPAHSSFWTPVHLWSETTDTEGEAEEPHRLDHWVRKTQHEPLPPTWHSGRKVVPKCRLLSRIWRALFLSLGTTPGIPTSSRSQILAPRPFGEVPARLLRDAGKTGFCKWGQPGPPIPPHIENPQCLWARGHLSWHCRC